MTFVATKLFHKAGEGSGGGGGGDQHNLGWYATESALTTAHPTATAGDWAIVGSTDTVWLWDTDNEEWVDSDQKGQVTSVNGQTGDVVLDLLPSQTGNAGKFLTTDGTDASWSNTIPELDIQQGTGTYHLKMKQITGTSYGLSFYTFNNVTGELYYNVNNHRWIFKGPYSNYFIFDEIYTCLRTSSAGGTLGNSSVKWDSIYVTKINNGADITVPNQAGTMVVADSTSATAGQVLTLDSNLQPVWQAGGSGGGLPDQTGQSGKFLTTDGTDASWSDKPLVNTATGTNSLTILGTAVAQDGNINIGSNSVINGSSTSLNNVLIGTNTKLGTGIGRSVSDTVLIGKNSQAPMFGSGVAVGADTYVYDVGLAAGWKAESRAAYAIQLGRGANSTANTFSVGLSASNNYRMLDSDGTIPADRFASTTGLADGNYRLRLTMTNGVPSLSWVAE